LSDIVADHVSRAEIDPVDQLTNIVGQVPGFVTPDTRS
jgi:hypothetical protein